MGLRLNRSETSRNPPPFSFVRQHPLPRPVSSTQLPACSTENRGHNPGQDILVSFRKFVLRETFLFVLRCVFLLFIAGTRDATRFVEEGCTKGWLYFTLSKKFLSCLFRIKKKEKMPRKKVVEDYFFFFIINIVFLLGNDSFDSSSLGSGGYW